MGNDTFTYRIFLAYIAIDLKLTEVKSKDVIVHQNVIVLEFWLLETSKYEAYSYGM